MKRSLKLRTLPLLLLTLSCATLCFAVDRIGDTCNFDEYFKDNHQLPLVEELPSSQSSSWTAYTATTTESWEPIRILVSTEDLHDATKYCNKMGNKVKAFTGKEAICTISDVLTAEKRISIKQIVRSAAQMHVKRLKVKPIKHGFKVPPLEGDFCSNFTIPDAHKNNGVLNADMVLYVSLLTLPEFYSMAIAAPCAKLPDGRPVVGALAYNTLNVYLNSHSVRVIAHHIAHVLGFSYNVMSQNGGVKLTKKTDARQKPHVTEVTGVHTVNAVKKHFKCQTATGMELEDEMGRLKAVSHSHWERRNAREDLMAPVISSGRYSALTLALFNDLGYYQAEMDEAEPMSWGADVGCDFLNKPCITNGITAFPSFFCSDFGEDNSICDDKLTALRCSKMDAAKDTVPSYFNYFSDNKLNYESSFVDNCPTWVRDYDIHCSNSKSKSTFPGYRVGSSYCLKKASGSTDINGSDKFKGMCASIESNENSDVYVTYDKNQRVTCTDGKATLGGSYSGVILECPTAELVRNRGIKEEEYSIVVSESEVNDKMEDYITQAIIKKQDQLQKEKGKVSSEGIVETIQSKTGQEENQRQPTIKSETSIQSANQPGSKEQISVKNSNTSGKDSRHPPKNEEKVFPETKLKTQDTTKPKSESMKSVFEKLPNGEIINNAYDKSYSKNILLSGTLFFLIFLTNAILK